MIALVMSGAGNYGVMQAGALETLLETGFRPKIVTGTSSGAINTVFIATNPTPTGARQLASLWGATKPAEILGRRPLESIRYLLKKRDGLFPSELLASFLLGYLPPAIRTFGQLRVMSGVCAYTTAARVDTGRLRIFGDDPDDLLIDGVTASAAMPPLFSPWRADDGHRYLDGGVYHRLPLRVAIERGATRIIALSTTNPSPPLRGISSVTNRAVGLMIEQQQKREVAWARSTGIPLRLIELPTPPDVSILLHREAERLARLGREITQKELEAEPLRT